MGFNGAALSRAAEGKNIFGESNANVAASMGPRAPVEPRKDVYAIHDHWPALASMGPLSREPREGFLTRPEKA